MNYIPSSKQVETEGAWQDKANIEWDENLNMSCLPRNTFWAWLGQELELSLKFCFSQRENHQRLDIDHSIFKLVFSGKQKVT